MAQMRRKWTASNELCGWGLALVWLMLAVFSPYSVLLAGCGLVGTFLILDCVLAPLAVIWAGLGVLVAGGIQDLGVVVFFLSMGFLLVLVRTCSSLSLSVLTKNLPILKDPYHCRKLARFLFLVFPLGVFPLWGLEFFRRSILVMGFCALILELIRAANLTVRRGMSSFFGHLGRPSEALEISGVTLFLMGSALAVLVPGCAGPAGVTVSALGDGMASLAGRRWGRWFWMPEKSGAGTAACFLASGAALLLLFPQLSLEPGKLAALILVSGFAEALFPGKWDNLIMAPLVAVAFWLMHAW